MPRYLIEIEAADNLPDQFEIELADREAVRAYVIELASDRLQSGMREGQPLIVHAVIRDQNGEILDTLCSTAELLD